MSTTQSNKVLLAGLVGLVAGILFAPDRGSKTREKLKKHAEEASRKAEEQINHAKESFKRVTKKKDKILSDTDTLLDTQADAGLNALP